MPMIKGAKARTEKGFSKNVEKEMKENKPQKQAVAIAYSEANSKKKPKKRKQQHGCYSEHMGRENQKEKGS